MAYSPPDRQLTDQMQRWRCRGNWLKRKGRSDPSRVLLSSNYSVSISVTSSASKYFQGSGIHATLWGGLLVGVLNKQCGFGCCSGSKPSFGIFLAHCTKVEQNGLRRKLETANDIRLA